MSQGEEQEADNELVVSFLAVRQALGVLGLALPSMLIGYAVISGNGIEPSISDFYHTTMGDILVGVLCAIGVFLFTYTGYDPRPDEWVSDRVIARLAGAAAIGIAIFPVSGQLDRQCDGATCPVSGLTAHPDLLHYLATSLFFICLAVFCLVLFPRTGGEPVTPRKARSNRIYRICGWIIVASLVGIIIAVLMRGEVRDDLRGPIADHDIVFWLETAGVLAFGVSWLVKGKALRSLKRLAAKVQSSVTDPADTPGKGFD